MMFSLMVTVPQGSNNHVRTFWKCERTDQEGDVVGVHIPETVVQGLWISYLAIVRSEVEDVIVHGVEKLPPSVLAGHCHCGVKLDPSGQCPSVLASMTKLGRGGLYGPHMMDGPYHPDPPMPTWTGGVLASSFVEFAKRGLGKSVEVGDEIRIVFTNLTPNAMFGAISFLIEDRSVSDQKLWWANEDDGKLVRALESGERRFKVGDKVAGRVVVDPATYEGFS